MSYWRGKKFIRHCSLLLGAALLSATFVANVAAEESGGFVIRTAYTELLDGVYYLNADIDLGLSQEALDALENGVPLTVELQIEVIQHRTWLWNKTTAKLTQRYKISYHALSRQFIVRNINSGEKHSYSTYRAAISQLGQINDLPVIDSSLLDPDDSYNIRMRAVLDIEDFPGPLRLFASFFSDWQLSSNWYQWVLRS